MVAADMEKRYPGTLESETMDLEDEHKSRDIDTAMDPHPIEMWTGPIPLEPNHGSTSTTTADGVDEEGGVGVVKRISTVRIVALTIIMILTYFLGVGLDPLGCQGMRHMLTDR